jgi:hypothetical protein
MKTREFIEAIRTEAMGFALGDPWRPEESSITCVVPIIFIGDGTLNYVTGKDAEDALEIVDSGSIDTVTVLNKGKLPVFMRMGEVLVGDTQNRALVVSRVIMPGQKRNITVKCVHASRPIRSGSGFKSYGYAPNRETMFARAPGNTPDFVTQSMSWEGDRTYYSATVEGVAARAEGEQLPHNVMDEIAEIPKDDLVKVRDKYVDTFKEILGKVPLLDNQVGMALIDTGGFHSLDCFNLHVPWKAVKEAIVGKEAIAITSVDNTGVFTYDPEKANSVIKRALGSGFEEKAVFSSARSQTITLDFKSAVGEVVVLDGNVIHLLIARKEAA